jgi:hypothetical protein
LLLVGVVRAEEVTGVGGLMVTLTRRVAEVASQGVEALLEGEGVEGAADGGETDLMPERLPAPAAEGVVRIVKPGIQGDRGGEPDLASEERREEHAEDEGLGGLGITRTQVIEVPDALEPLEE